MTSSKSSSPDKPTCFVIMPFTVRDDDIDKYLRDPRHWNEVYEGLIAPAVEDAGMVPDRDDQDRSNRIIINGIIRKVENASIILCDVSANNPNVFLELGWALRADKPFVLLKDDRTSYSFDMQGFMHLDYDHRLQPSHLKEKIQELSNTLRNTLDDNQRSYSLVRQMQIDARVLQAAREGDVLAKALSAVVGEVRSVKDVVLGNSKQTRRPDHPFFKQLTFVEIAALMCSAVKVVMDRSGCVTLTLPEGMPFHGVSAAMVADYAHECGVQFEHNWGKRTE